MNFSRLAASCVSALFLIASVSRAAEESKVGREVHLMGTVAVLEIYAEDRDTGLSHLEGFIRVLEATDRELSTWQLASTVSQLNRHPLGHPFSAERPWCDLLRELKRWNHRTGGAFDPAVGTLMEAWGIYGSGRAPSRQALAVARDRTGLRYLDLDENSCSVVRRKDVLIDVGGFGKGEALDRVLAYSSRHGLDGWMVDLGGQVLVDGTPPGRNSWQVALAHPSDRRRPVFELALTSGSLATSGGSERDVQDGDRRIGHVLDPRTGLTVVRNVSVTVWHTKALVADVLATALYVMGVEEGLAWADQHGLAACFLIPDPSGEVLVHASKAFAEQFLSISN